LEVKELKPGETLGRYQLLMPIAKGGMGQVWAARQMGTRGFQKLVAVKTILAEDEDSGNLETMLFEEASLASQIRHPNVAQTLDLGEQDGTLYLVMEWIDGEPLDFILKASRHVGGIPIAIAVHIVIQACKGLHAAHEAKNPKGEPLGIVHRDISPQNLLVTYSGVVKLVDFGVAKATHQTSQPTALGQVKGKFAYMSPEQVNGQKIDARSDVFAMGIVLYRLTTGRHPFKSETPAATIHNILTTHPAHPSVVVQNYPAALEQVVMKALARDRAERFASAHEMMVALEQALPEIVSANAEKNTETFLRRLFEKRIAEKHDAMQAALKAAQGDSVKVGPGGQILPGSQATMRAVSVESTGSTGDGSAGASQMQAVAMSMAPPRRGWRWSAVAIVAGAAVAFGGLTWRSRWMAERGGAAASRGAVIAAPVVTGVQGDGVPGLTATAVAAEMGAAPIASTVEPSAVGDAGAAGRATTPTPGQKRRPARREVVPNAPEPAPVVSPARPAAPTEPAPVDVDPLNRRR
jgi:serine/threonine-protein kinase